MLSIDGELVGAAELRSNTAIWTEQAPFGRHIHAEAAFSVEEGNRRRGIGEKLFRRIQRAASNHGVETIEMYSDGYFSVPSGFGVAAWEEEYRRVEQEDPHKIGRYMSTKGSTDISLTDDRTYLGIRLT